MRIKGVWVDEPDAITYEPAPTYIEQGEVIHGKVLELIVEKYRGKGSLVVTQRDVESKQQWRQWYADQIKIDYDYESAGACEGNWAPDLEACAICSIKERCKKASLLMVPE